MKSLNYLMDHILYQIFNIILNISLKKHETVTDNPSIMIYVNRVRFNDLRFVFHDSSWSFYQPYFSRKHVFHELYRVNGTQDYGLKTWKQVPNYHVIISQRLLSTTSTIIHLFIEQKFCKHFIGSWKQWDN